MSDETKNTKFEKYFVAVQHANGNWWYARVGRDDEIEFVPDSECYRDISWFRSEADAVEWWQENKHCCENSAKFDKYFLRDTICIRKRVTTEEIEQGLSW